MARKTIHSEFRVEVYPGRVFGKPYGDEDEQRSDCETIAEQVRRHVDNVSQAYVESDREFVCEHCGCPWTEAGATTYNGGCCDEDIEAEEKREASDGN